MPALYSKKRELASTSGHWCVFDGSECSLSAPNLGVVRTLGWGGTSSATHVLRLIHYIYWIDFSVPAFTVILRILASAGSANIISPEIKSATLPAFKSLFEMWIMNLLFLNEKGHENVPFKCRVSGAISLSLQQRVSSSRRPDARGKYLTRASR